MNKNSIKKLCWIVAVSSLVTLITGCAEPAAPKPWDTGAFNQTSFTFSDNDPAEKIISGDIKITGIPKLDGVQSYLIYWGDSSSESGKGSLLKEISGTPSSGTLYTVSKGTPMVGSYFQLFLKTKDSGEKFSGKSLFIKDLFVPVPVKVVEKTRKAVSLEVKTPEVQKTVKAKAAPVVINKARVVKKEIEQPQQPKAIAAPASVLTPVETPVAPSASTGVVEQSPDIKVEIPVIIVKNVLFEFDKYNIQEAYKQQLLLKLDNVENKDQVKLLIAGHADERGSNAYNLALGERRAYAVKRFLISMGYMEENIKIVSYGEEKPVETGHNESAWAKNRRAETSDLRKVQ